MAAALAIAHGDWGHSDDKGRAWIERDVARIIGKWLCAWRNAGQSVLHPTARAPKPCTTQQRGRGRPPCRLQRAGRQISAGAARLYDWLHENFDGFRVSLATNAELAQVLDCTERTIRRYLDELEAADLIARHLKPTIPSGRTIRITAAEADTKSAALN
jgi:hypothetical protein